MPLKIKTSKFRHTYGQPTRRENCFENIRITKNAHDSNFCAVNPKFLAVVLESVGGGAFTVLPLKQIGRVDINAPKICGHAAVITDIKWNPFDDHVIASCSEDLTIKVWEIPELGLHCNMTRCMVELLGHGRRVTYIEWHPTAENILLSCAFDYRCIVWDVAQGQPLNVISCHSTTIYSISWNYNGSLFATSCKDKKIRVIDPRTSCVLQEGEAHNSLKTCKIIFLKNHKLFTTGFSRNGDRVIALWNANDLSQPLYRDTIDYSSGILLPYYDADIDLVYLAGKGDGNIRYFEVCGDTVNYLHQYSSGDPQRGLGQMPKRGLDVSKFEIARFYKLHTNKQIIEPLPMIVPRRSEEFAEDIYPPTLAANPALTTEEWASGIDREPVKVSVKPRRRRPTNDLQAIIELAERGNTSEASRIGALRSLTKAQQRTQVVKPVQKVPQASPPPKNAPASLQNMYKLCTDTSKINYQSLQPKSPASSHHSDLAQHEQHEPSPPAGNLLPSQVRQEQQQPHFSPPRQQHNGQSPPQQHNRQSQKYNSQSQQQYSTQSQQHNIQQNSGQQQSDHLRSSHHGQPSVKQAHVRPNSQSEELHQQRYPNGHQQQQQQHQSQICSTPYNQPQQQQQYTGHHIHNQAIGQKDQQQQIHTYQQESTLPHQDPSGQPLKWKNNLAWQKPAAPVGSTFERAVPAQYKVIGHHMSSPRHNRQVSAPVVAQVQPKQAVNGSHNIASASSLSNDELHKAYFKQCEEIKQLRQLNQAKDKKIETLEKELGQLKKMIISF